MLLKPLCFLFFIFSFPCFAGETCTYGSKNQCPKGEVSAQLYPSVSECVSFEAFLPFVQYPFPEKRAILCDQGVKSPVGNSHTYLNTIFALDLKTPKGTDPDGIKAGLDGVAYVFNECVEHNTSCGNGWGNYGRILGANGVVVQYAHLDRVWVQTGQFIKAGTYIGLEGTTGSTGFENRHLHLSVHYKKHYSKEDFFNGVLPKSIPFKMNICQKQHGTCDGNLLDVRKLQCKRKTGKFEWVKTFSFQE